MAVKIKFDNNRIPLQPTFVLANKNGNKLGCIPAKNISFADKFNSASELQFKVYKEESGVVCPLWDEIIDFKLVWCPEWDEWFEIHVEVNESNSIVKNVSAMSVGESELSQINLYNIEINTETDISRDDYVVTVLYDDENPKASLLNRITEKAPHYGIGHIDSTIADIQRTFTFDEVSILDALYQIGEEIGCIFIIDSGTSADGKIARTINVYDLQSYCYDCGYRNVFTGACPKCGSDNVSYGYGQDTNVYISRENLTDEITYTSDTDSVKNCFRLVGGDDLMTATIANCNPNGGGYLWYFSDEMKEDMSDELRAKIEEYDKEYQEYVNNREYVFPAELVTKYNELASNELYKTVKPTLKTISNPIVGYSGLMQIYYDTIDFEMLLRYDLMPSIELSGTTAQQELAKLTSEALSPVAVANLLTCSSSTATSAVLNVAKQIVRSDYQVKVESSSFSGEIWNGKFIVTNYSDDEDTATNDENITVTISGDQREYLEQRMEKVLAGKREDINDIVSIFKLNSDDFRNEEVKKYSLSCLESMRDSCQSCLDILIENGIADSQSQDDPSISRLYNSLYLPYFEKLNILIEEVAIRESELATIVGEYDENGGILTEGMQTAIQDINSEVQSYLDFEKYLGHDFVSELAAYRREDKYQNDNFISDGLDNQEIFSRALEFIELAKTEIYKSATLQHSISSTLKNLLVMKEFTPIVDTFEVGNWLTIRVGDKSYRLRLTSYEIDFEDLTTLNVEFSDVVETVFGASDVESILKRASSMSSAFGYVKRQAHRGEQSHEQLSDYMEKGLALTQMKIVSNPENQNVTMDHHGLLCREKSEYEDEYDERQLKIINKGLYLTDDGWRTAKSGIGQFIYYDPNDEENHYKVKYGVIADVLIAPLILSEDVGVYNLNNTIRLNNNGLTIISKNDDDTSKQTVFKLQKAKTVDGEEVITDVIFFDDNGNAHFEGLLDASNIQSGDLLADRIKGGILSLGGVDNDNGIIYMFDSAKKLIGIWDNNGIRFGLNGIDLREDNCQYAQFNSSGFKLSLENGEVATGLYGIGNTEYSCLLVQNSYDRSVILPQLMRVESRSRETGSYAGVYFEANNDDCVLDCSITDDWSEEIHAFRMWKSDPDGNVPDGSITYSGRRGVHDTKSGGVVMTVSDDGLHLSGSFYVDGGNINKYRVMSTEQYSKRLLSAYETPTPMFGDVGEATIGEDGRCYVWLDAIFAQMISTDQYQVFLQRYGDGDCYVTDRNPNYFVVAGSPGLQFGWEIKAKQRDFDQKRLEKYEKQFKVSPQTYDIQAIKHIEELKEGRIEYESDNECNNI